MLAADAGIFSSTRHQSRFGWAVALGREVLFIGAPQENTLGLEAGAAHAFDVAIDETSRWLHRFYYVSNHLGSVRATANARGAVVHYDDYEPCSFSHLGDERQPLDDLAVMGWEELKM